MKARTAPGTVGLLTKIPEYEVALQVALSLEVRLLDRGFDVVLTRRLNQVSLGNIERAQLASSSGSDICIKIHCNGVRSSLRYLAFWKRGTLTLVPSRVGPTAKIFGSSMKFAEVVHRHLISRTHFPDLGIQERTNLTGFNWSTIPVILLELGYLTNPTEESLLVSEAFQHQVADAIADGVVESHEHLQL